MAKYTPIHPLEKEGDRLLAEHSGRVDGKGRDLYGVGSSAVIAGARNVFSNQGLVCELSRSKVGEGLGVAESHAVLLAANLTERQNSVIRRVADGWTYEAIGKADRTTKQGASRVASQARKKLQRAIRSTPLVGLREVYGEETSRRGFGHR